MKNGSFYISIFGKILIDYLEIYKKFSYQSLSSHRLAVVAEVEKLSGKIKLNPAATGSHKVMYEEYFDDYVLYNIRDVEIMVELEERYDFFTMLSILTCQSLCKMENTTKMVRLIESFLIQFMRENNMVMPRFSPSKKIKYPGAFVKEPIPGKYGWIIDFDVVSMYPTHTIVGNYSFETYLGKLYGIKDDIRVPYDMFEDQQVNDFIRKCDELKIIK
jgi:DNA polymerase elongation subunit (family B)